jgi:hypothetical protein
MVVGGVTYAWTPWASLMASWQERALPATPGLYRIRRVGREDLDYIGETSRQPPKGYGLRERIGSLKRIYDDEMPYRDPHTAAPALWALLHRESCEFEVSVVPVDGDVPWRKGLETVAIALYRQERGRSPTVNFGRMPSGYVMSSANNASLVASGKRFRGGPSDVVTASHFAGVAPVGRLDGESQSRDWGGHGWSEWIPLDEWRRAPVGIGLYRIRGLTDGLVYVGQGAMRARLSAHRRKTLDPASTKPQDVVLRRHRPLEWSAVEGSWEPHQRLELENDLIAAHVLELARVPPAQFLS